MIISSNGKELSIVSSVTVISDQEFDKEVFNVEKPVLVYFWAGWCGPCRLVSPSIDWVAKTYDERLKVVKLEIDPNPDAVAKCKVEGVPALRIFKDNEIIASHEGAIGKQQLQSFIDTYVS
jgi:thioredoxin 1